MNYMFNTVLGGQDQEPQYGGLDELYFINKDNIVSFTLTADKTGVATMSLKASTQFVKVDFFAENATYKSEFKVAGTDRYFEQTADFTVLGQDAATITATRQMLLTNKLVALTKRASGNWTMLSLVGTGLTATAGSQNAVAEQNGRVFSLAGKSSYEPLLVEDTLAITLV